MRPLPLFLLLAAAAGPAAAKGPPAGWARYESRALRLSFLYPAGLTAETVSLSSGAFLVKLSSAACVAATLEAVDYGSSPIDLPKRGSDLAFDPGRNWWVETRLDDEDEDEEAPRPRGPVPVCLPRVRLGDRVEGYSLADAMHGWWTTVVLTGAGKAFLWSNVRRKDVDYCPEDFPALPREVALPDGVSAAAADCPPAAAENPKIRRK